MTSDTMSKSERTRHLRAILAFLRDNPWSARRKIIAATGVPEECFDAWCGLRARKGLEQELVLRIFREPGKPSLFALPCVRRRTGARDTEPEPAGLHPDIDQE